MTIDHRIATYGTLAPGKPNHHHLSDMPGHWQTGHVTGTLVEKGWGARLGFPALVLDDHGTTIAVALFESRDLPQHWARLDAFEGAEYRRVAVTVTTDHGSLDAWIYINADPQP